MKLRSFMFSLFFILQSFTYLAFSPPENKTKPSESKGAVSNEIIVKYKEGVSESAKTEIEKSLNAKRIETLPMVNAVRLKVEKSKSIEKAQKFEASKNVLFAEPNFRRKAFVTPNDTLFNKQWGLHNTGQSVNGERGLSGADIEAPAGWSKAKGSDSVIIAVVDTGTQWSHPDLVQNCWVNGNEVQGNNVDDDNNGFVDDYRGWDFYYNDNTTYDNTNDYHGTHVAGIIGAKTNNGKGVSGINWSVKIMPVKFIGDFGYGTVADEIKSLAYAANNGANIINASYGSTEYSKAERAAIKELQRKGVLLVAASGNWGENNDAAPVYPSSYGLPNIISVAMSNNRDDRSEYSNFGVNTVDIFAPGIDVISTYPKDRYSYLSGTSMATPHVTGTAGLLAARFGMDYLKIKRRLFLSVDAKDSFLNIVSTGGRLNLFDSLRNSEPVISFPKADQVLSRGSSYTVKWSNPDAAFMKYRLQLSQLQNAKKVENFESALPDKIEFKGNAEWAQTSATKYSGKTSFVSGDIGDTGSSSFQFVRYIQTDSYISFAYKVSSEYIYPYSSGDSLQFYIDGSPISAKLSGGIPWSRYRVFVTKGWHTFKWVYAKDYSISRGSDCAWIDDIRFSEVPQQKKFTAIGTTSKGATSYNWSVPSALLPGKYNLHVFGMYNGKRTASAVVNHIVIK